MAKRTLTDEEKDGLYNDIREFLADEFEVEVDEITKDTNIIEDLGGDSILFLEMICRITRIMNDFCVQIQIIVHHPIDVKSNSGIPTSLSADIFSSLTRLSR